MLYSRGRKRQKQSDVGGVPAYLSRVRGKPKRPVLITKKGKCDNIVMKIFGERLKEIREERAVSMSALARQIGTSQQNISRWEGGETVPSAETIVMLCKFLHISSDFLLGLSDDI